MRVLSAAVLLLIVSAVFTLPSPLEKAPAVDASLRVKRQFGWGGWGGWGYPFGGLGGWGGWGGFGGGWGSPWWYGGGCC
nr:unnamed protein product [Haemonchus contortus]